MLVAACLLGTGCSPTGPLSVRGDRFNYNQVGAQSTREQLLLNIVRLRYHEPVYLLEIGSMISSHTLRADASLSGWSNNLNELENPTLMAIYGNDKHATRQRAWSAGLGYTDSPTITYAPVQGEKLAGRMMTSIPQATLFELSQSGWGIDQLLECCVQRVNGIPNRPIAGMRHTTRVEDPRFRRVATLMRAVQDAGLLVFAIEAASDGDQAVYLRNTPDLTGLDDERRELRELLGYAGGPVETLKLVPAPFKTSQNELAMQTRSLLGVMSALSRGVAVPGKHVDRGWAEADCPIPADPADPADEARWLRIGCSVLPNPEAYVQIFYKGHWFHIDEGDVVSKRTFALLDYLFSLQQTEKGQGLPVITVPAR